MLLTGQGGSAKTAIVQQIAPPAMDFLFGRSATQTICAKWLQVENISAEHREDKAALLGIGEHRREAMVPAADAQTRLDKIW